MVEELHPAQQFVPLKYAMATTMVVDTDATLRNSTMTDKGITDTVAEIWTPPTFSAGKVPQVAPGKCNDQEIGGDFPLDQIVIDRE